MTANAPQTLPLDAALQQAIAHHQAGRWQDAERLYRAILQTRPDHPDAHHNLGILAVQVKQPAAGLPHFKAALEANPKQGQYWLSYIDALMRAGQTATARQVLEQGRRYGLQGEAVEVLAGRLEDSARVAARPDAEDAASEPLPVPPTVKKSKPASTHEFARKKSVAHKGKSPSPQEIEALMVRFGERRYAEAASLARAMTVRFPRHGFGWKALGAVLKQMGQTAEALEQMQKAAALLPDDAEAHNNLGNTLNELGRLAEAEASYRRALQLKPDYAEVHYNLGNTLNELGRLNEAEAGYRRALQIKPDYAEAYNNLSATLKKRGRLNEAEASYRRALQLKPDYAEAHNNLGVVLKELGRLAEAEASYRRALQLKPDYPEAYSNLGVTLKDLGRRNEAEVCCRQALALKPDYAEAHNNLGNILQATGRLEEAEASFRRALQIKPDYAEVYSNLGITLLRLSRLQEAETCCRLALQFKPDFAEAHHNLATLLAYLSDFDQVVAESNTALHLNPDDAAGWEQRLYAFSYHPDLTAREIYAEFVRWGDRFPDPVVDFSSHDRTLGRRLRVGYVSPDFRRHTSRFFFWPLFANHDHAVVELFAYSNVKIEDDFTRKFKGVFDHWRNIRGVADSEVANMIREDGIDILVDGCSHMQDDRLGVFVLKPAPVQVTWLGAAWTTGLKTMDYALIDPYMAPIGTLTRETIVRLPHCFVAYCPPEETAGIASPPCLKNGYLTFGYTGRTERLNHHTFRVWGEILRQLPDARLILDFGAFADPPTQAHYRQFMARHGVDISRVIMRKSADIFAGLNDIDILLDSFPHSGGTMLFDALWMGVPILTLASRPPVGRIGTSLMTNLGLPEWVAESHEEYIGKACALAKNTQMLAQLRAGMRERMQNSPLMDGAGFARGVEAAYREMFEKWVLRLEGAAQVAARPDAEDQQATPSPQEIDAMVALFGERRYAEAATLARTMTVHYPLHGFGWKVLGAVFKQMGRSTEALEPMQKAAALSPGDAEAHNNLGSTLTDLGRLGEAVSSYQRVLQIRPDYAEAHSSLGANLNDLGQLDAAEASYRRALQLKPDYAEAHNNLGNTLKDMGRLDEAEASYRRALQIKPDYADAHYNLGITLHELDRLSEAEASYRRALEIKPDYADAHNNLGITLQGLGRLSEAEASYRRVLEIKPDYADAHNNLGNTLKDTGRLDEAEASYRRALQIEPDYAEAHNNLGVTLKDLGRPDEAEASYRQALRIKPDFVDALNNLALLLNAQGKSTMALGITQQSLQTRETEEAQSIFVACVKHLRYMQDDSRVRATMVRALTEPWGRPGELAQVGISLVKLNPDIRECVARATGAWPVPLAAHDLFGSNDLATLEADSLLHALLVSAPICDIEMERFLTMARCAMLDAASGAAASGGGIGAALSFCGSLARQCFINEYAFSYTPDEIRKAGALRDALVAALETNSQIPALWPLAVAAYFPLRSLPLATRLLDRQWLKAVAAVLVQQVREPEEELQLRTAIPRLTDIEDEVSLLVQSQYEENPYPRWVKAAPAGKAKSIVGYLCQKFPLASFRRHGTGGGTDILIAGCGTGQHSIGTAQHFQGARVLAIDLSLSSLGYAKRKTRELGLTSIEYAQADLLKLGSLGRSFDLVESAGVLHHLADPWAGWRVLLSLLRPGGFMKLGFYSEVARRNIVRIRTFIAEQGYGSTAEDIRRCRQDLVDLDKSADFGTTLKSSDFFSISTCRDLLFHVQEHRMTLTGIDAFLRENDLAFLGFEIGGDALHAYKRRFPDDRAATHLGQWQVFENENPDTFIGMYQFWIQKAC